MIQYLAQKIHHEITKNAQRILLVPHTNPDGDSLSSACAFFQYINQHSIPHHMYCSAPISSELQFLPHVEHICYDLSVLENIHFDAICVFDSGDLQYAGIAEFVSHLSYRPVIINFDHHYTNEQYGTYNFVLTDAAATTEVLYRYFVYNSIPIDKQIATCLLTGLVTDTGNFSNPATSASALSVAADLVRRGGKLPLITKYTLQNKSLNMLRLWGKVLSGLEHNQEMDIAYTVLTQKDAEEFGISGESCEGIANFLNNLGEARAALVLRELGGGKIKGSFRTTRADVDVSVWAKELGGGGHKKAAGFTIPGKLIETVDGWSAQGHPLLERIVRTPLASSRVDSN